FGQVVAQRRVPAPVGAGDRAQPVQRELVPAGFLTTAEVMVAQQLGRVDQVLGVDLDDLQLGQQQVGDAQRVRQQGEPAGQVQRVAHGERADEYVELPSVHGVVEEQPPVAAQG